MLNCWLYIILFNLRCIVLFFGCTPVAPKMYINVIQMAGINANYTFSTKKP